jgi:histone-lysine N-methyltransferase SETD3
MLNHRRPQQTAWEYSDKRNSFIIESKEDIKRGNQVYDSYGKKCNSRFFLNYGFINENNDANEVPIEIQIDIDDPLRAVKLKILGFTDSRKIRVSEDLSEKNMHHFFSFLRFAVFEGDPMKLYSYQFEQKATKKSEDDEDDAYQGNNISPISPENEKKVLMQVQFLAQQQLDKYPTEYEEDLKILAENKTMSWNNRDALLMRMGEKKVMSSTKGRYCSFC